MTNRLCCFYHLPPGFLSLHKEEPLPELFPQTLVSSYYWPRRSQVADKIVSPSCFRSSLPPCPFSWCPLCHSFSPSVVVESCNVSRSSMYSLLDNVDDVMSYPSLLYLTLIAFEHRLWLLESLLIASIYDQRNRQNQAGGLRWAWLWSWERWYSPLPYCTH